LSFIDLILFIGTYTALDDYCTVQLIAHILLATSNDRVTEKKSVNNFDEVVMVKSK